MNPQPPPPLIRSSHPACAACRYQRRKCNPDCPLARYFPPENQTDFLNAHKLFGVSNIIKIIRSLDPPLKDDAMRTIIYQSNARAADPVGGCCRIISDLRRKIDLHAVELKLVLHQLAFYRHQIQQQIHHHDLHHHQPSPSSSTSSSSSSSNLLLGAYNSNSNNNYMQDLILPYQQQQLDQPLLFHNLTINDPHHHLEQEQQPQQQLIGFDDDCGDRIQEHEEQQQQALIESTNHNGLVGFDQWLVHNQGPGTIDGAYPSSPSLHVEQDNDQRLLVSMIDEKPFKNQLQEQEALVGMINGEGQVRHFDSKETTQFSDRVAENDGENHRIEVEGEANYTKNVEEHDLKEAASSFSLTNKKT